jgi:acetyl esterase/lipase
MLIIMRLLSLLTALSAALLFFRPRNGVLHAFLWLPKLFVTALAPLLALAGGLWTVAGLWRKDLLVVGAGLAGALAAVWRITQFTRRQEASFSEAFGPEWKRTIAPNLQESLSARPWQPWAVPRHPAELERDVVYAINEQTGWQLQADILRPPADVEPTGLAMIYVHGGAWRLGRRNIDKFPYFRKLAAQGHLVMDIDYTLAPQGTMREMVLDVKRAVSWLKAHAAEYQIDPQRIVLAGQSAGGHLSLLVAYTANHPELHPPELGDDVDSAVRGVISFYGPTDLLDLHDDVETRFGSYLENRLPQMTLRLLKWRGHPMAGLFDGMASVVGAHPADDPEPYALLSPLTYACADCPPTLLVHGDHDFLVNGRGSEDLYRRLSEAGAPVVFLSFPGCDHSFDSVLPRLSPASQAAAYHIERFLALMV